MSSNNQHMGLLIQVRLIHCSRSVLCTLTVSLRHFEDCIMLTITCSSEVELVERLKR